MEEARILRTESGLHIKRRTRHVGKHQHGCPFRNSHTSCQLANGQRDGLVMHFDCFSNTIKRFFIFIIVQLAVTGSENDFIIFKHWMQFELLGKSFCTCYSVQQPKSVFQFIPEFRRRKWELVLRCKSIKKFIHICIMNKLSGFIRLEKLIQVECILLDIVIGKFYAFPDFVTDDVRHLIRVQ